MEKELEIEFDFKDVSENTLDYEYHLYKDVKDTYNISFNEMIDLKDYIDVEKHKIYCICVLKNVLYLNSVKKIQQAFPYESNPIINYLLGGSFLRFIFESNDIYEASIIIDKNRIEGTYSKFKISFTLNLVFKQDKKYSKSYVKSLVNKIIKNNTFKIVYSINSDIYN